MPEGLEKRAGTGCPQYNTEEECLEQWIQDEGDISHDTVLAISWSSEALYTNYVLWNAKLAGPAVALRVTADVKPDVQWGRPL